MDPTTEWVEHRCVCGEVTRGPQDSDIRCTVKRHRGKDKYPIMRSRLKDRMRRRMVERVMPAVRGMA